MKTALPNASGDLFQLDDRLVEQGIAASRQSPRRRMIFPIHRRQSDLVQRMLNFFQPGTRVTPHLHPRESASELIFVIRGRIGFLTFDEGGVVREKVSLGRGDLIDIEPRVWHTLVALEEDTVILEIKRGPYDDEDKVFADWAPAEDTPEAAALVRVYEAMFEEGGDSR